MYIYFNTLLNYYFISQLHNHIGWTARVEPSNHPVSEFEFDFIVGADGKRNTLPGFKRKCFRAKQALAITFNLVNRKTRADTQVYGYKGSQTLK